MSKYVLYQFRPTETIDAVIRLKGRHNYTQEEIAVLRAEFNRLNGMIVPRAGQMFKIPLEAVTMDDYGNLVRTIDVPVVLGPAHDGEEPTDG